MITKEQIEFICGAYGECINEQERNEVVEDFSEFYEVPLYEIRQVLLNQGIYKKKEGKTEKEQLARALYAITLISEKEWMKLTIKSLTKLMDVFRKSNHD